MLKQFCSPVLRQRSTPAVETLEPRLLLTTVYTVAELYAAINNGLANDTIVVMPGTYELTSPLAPKAGQIIQGSGIGQTILTGASSWAPSTAMLPDNGTSISSCDASAYLFSFPNGTLNVTITNMTLTGPQLHGALLGNNCDGLKLFDLHIEDFLWSGVRTFLMGSSEIHDNTFVNAGGRWQAGLPGTSGGVTGGALYLTYVADTTVWNNEISKTYTAPERNFYGMKHRQAKRCHYYDNTILVNFSMEFPFENDENVEIDHNYMTGTVSIPKSGGGPVPVGGYTFHLHHNYFSKSYSLEWPRNGAEVDHNLFDIQTTDDTGNLITKFGTESCVGPTKFHDNLVMNPGRGIFSASGVYNNLEFYNNHIIANTTVTPRTDGLFGFATGSDFTTIAIRDNIIECNGTARPLVRNSASYAAVIENNTLTNVSDTANYANPNTGDPRGPLAPLYFAVGAYGEYTVDGWNCAPTVVTLATEGFETNNWTGGTGWSAGWTRSGSTALVTTVHSGTRAARLLTTGQITRTTNLTGATDARLQMWWRADTLEAGEYAHVEVYDGSWHEVLRINDGQDTATYAYADIDLSSYSMTSAFQLRISIHGNATDDKLFVDDIQIVGAPGGMMAASAPATDLLAQPTSTSKVKPSQVWAPQTLTTTPTSTASSGQFLKLLKRSSSLDLLGEVRLV